MTKAELIANLTKRLISLAPEDRWSVPLPDVLSAAENAVEEWYTIIDFNLDELTNDWEETMGTEDNTLYSLGIRRAHDVMLGADPKQFESSSTTTVNNNK